ncbi:MAG: MAPEG family protein [Alphaproteobacteria bacterium]|nr:MAPEG family protein [Alphaproteobacteria bacterium]
MDPTIAEATTDAAVDAVTSAATNTVPTAADLAAAAALNANAALDKWLDQLAYPSLITLLALAVYLLVTLNVGRARGRFNVPAPQTTGNADFERFFRVQQNTLEQLVFFLPALWLASFYGSVKLAAILGMLWVGGRLVYANGYYRAPAKRVPGFAAGIAASSILWLIAMIGVARILL